MSTENVQASPQPQPVVQPQPQPQPVVQPQAQPQPAAAVPVQAAPKKSGMSTGAKVGIGLCAGCLILLVIGGIVMSVAGTALVKFAPSFLKSALESKGVNVDEGKNSVSVKDEDSGEAMEIGEEVDMPSNFPSDLPVYEPSTPIFSLASGKAGTVTLSTPATVATVTSYYTQEMESEGWTKENEFEISGVKSVSYTKGLKTATVMIGENQDSEAASKYKSTITLSYDETEPSTEEE